VEKAIIWDFDAAKRHHYEVMNIMLIKSGSFQSYRPTTGYVTEPAVFDEGKLLGV